MDIILGKVICLVVDQVNTYISLVLGTGSGRSPFFCKHQNIYVLCQETRKNQSRYSSL